MTSLAFDLINIRAHGLAYTALSRIKDPQNLHLLRALEHSHKKVDSKVIDEVERMRTNQTYIPTQKQLQKVESTTSILSNL